MVNFFLVATVQPHFRGVEFKEKDHAAGFGGEGLRAVGEVDSPVKNVVLLYEHQAALSAGRRDH